jgi:electron-transferring-flavoprotein dehydrogenase
VTRARSLKSSFPSVDPSQIPLGTKVTREKTVYLADPLGVSRRPLPFQAVDAVMRTFAWLLPVQHEAIELPWTPAFLHKSDGWVLSMGQFMQWVSSQVQASGVAQIWPASPVAGVVTQQGAVRGIQLMDQGTDRLGNPAPGFLPGMKVRAALTVVGDGPVGVVGQQLDAASPPSPTGRSDEWAVGMKFVVDLPASSTLQPGTVIHTIGYPEPEIFGFLYVHPDRICSLGIFVPSWFKSPVRTAYRYLQHWMLHPYLWQYLEGGRVRSWGAKTINESGRPGEPCLVGDGYARIGESSGTTNVLTGSGVDEAWESGALLAAGVIDLLEHKQPFTRENLERAYVKRRRASWLEAESRQAEKARDGFHSGVIPGLIGMALTGLTGGRLHWPVRRRPPAQLPSLEDYFEGRIPSRDVQRIREECLARSTGCHDAIMDRLGWPRIKYDDRLLISHQDALLLGGKVQASPGYADHVVFLHPNRCRECSRICVEICSGQAITPGRDGSPSFDRDKCIHCGACWWNCPHHHPAQSNERALAFGAGAGGLHSAEN